MDEKHIQQRYLEFQMLDQQIKQLQKHMQNLDAQIDEIMAIKQALDEIKEVKEGTEILVPITNGIFIKALAKDTTVMHVNVGFNTNVEKSVEETKKLMNDQMMEVHKQHDMVSMQLQDYLLKAKRLEEELMQLTENV